MGKLSEKHYSPDISKRKLEYFHPIYKCASHSKKEFDRVERVLDEATCDLINGKSKSDILLKLENGLYTDQPKGLCHQKAEEYFRAILSRLKVDEPDIDNAKASFYSMYLNLYNEAMEMGNTLIAKQVLDSMVKLMGLDKPPTTAIQINSGKENGVTVNFGFDKIE